MKMRKIVLLLVGFFLLTSVESGLAGDLTPVSLLLPGVYAGAVDWGDYDNDGDLDFVICGELGPDEDNLRITRLYKNTDAGFVLVALEFEGVYFGDAAFGDYDNDGDLDLAITGINNNGLNTFLIYKNNNGIFTIDDNQTELIAVRYSSLDWGDYNNDGYLDLVVTGMNEFGESRTTVYENEMDGIRNVLKPDQVQSVLHISKGDAVWYDYDGDGDLDLTVSGFDVNGSRAAKIFKNEPLGILREDKTNSEKIYKLSSAHIAWGDVDGDGDQDFLQTGWYDGWFAVGGLFINGAGGILEEDQFITNNFYEPYLVGPVAWGDYDNDGDLDVAIMGQNKFSEMYGYILKNEPTGTLVVDGAQSALTGYGVGLRNGNIAWGDYDGDGDLDLIAVGEDGDGNRHTTLYENNEADTNPNIPPEPPVELRSVYVTNQYVIFSWSAGSDNETNDKMLSYHLQIGTSQDGHQVYSGFYKPGVGNMGGTLEFRLNRPLPIDTYYWSVRTVDAQYKLSAPKTGVFIVKQFVNSKQSLLDFKEAQLAWGDYNGDDTPDLIIGGEDVNGNTRTIIYDNVAGVLTENTNLVIQSVKNGDYSWSDFDNDGDLDLALAGNTIRSGTISLIYRNEPTGHLSIDQLNSPALPGLGYASLDWGDYDNDGDLDLVMSGQDQNGEFITEIYRNDGDTLTKDDTNQLMGYGNGDVEWVDFDNDGDLDLAIIGDTYDALDYMGRIYINDGTGKLTEDSILPGLFSSEMEWGDFDNDGDYDLALLGQSIITGDLEFLFYRNDPPGTLTNKTDSVANTVPGIRAGDLKWGDYDHDGDLDIVVTGNIISASGTEPYLEAFENKNGVLVLDEYSVFSGRGVDFSSVSLQDIEGDGDLDVIAVGRSGDGALTAVYDNVIGIRNKNRIPKAPTGLSSSVDGNTVALSWEPVSEIGIDDNPTPDQALTFNIRVGTFPGAGDMAAGIYPPGFGQRGFIHTDTLRNLSSNVYYWSVQAIDNGLDASTWAVDKTFIIDIIKPYVDTVIVTPPVAGIGKVTILVTFEENFSLNLQKSPLVKIQAGDDTVNVSPLSYDGKTWIGEATIPPNFYSGQANVSVANAFDLQGNQMNPEPQAGTFLIDTSIPRVVSTYPEENQASVLTDTSIVIQFSKPVDLTAVQNPENFQLLTSGNPVETNPPVYNSQTMRVILEPKNDMASNTVYDVRVISRISDLVGNTMDGDHIWSFRTIRTITLDVNRGGTFENEEKTVRLTIAPRSYSKTLEFPIIKMDIQSVSPVSGVAFTGLAYSVGPRDEDITLDKPATLTLFYDENLLPPGINESKLSFFRLESISSPAVFDWDNPLGGTVNTDSNMVSTAIRQLGTFGLFEDIRDLTRMRAISKINFTPRVFTPIGSSSENLPAETHISFELGRTMNVSIDIFNQAGRFICRLTNSQQMNAGYQVVTWDGRDKDQRICPSGIYIVKIQGEGVTEFKTVGILNK